MCAIGTSSEKMYGVTSLSELIANKCGAEAMRRIIARFKFCTVTTGACAISVCVNNIRGKNGRRGRAHGSDDTRFQGRYTYKINTGKQEFIVNKKHVNNDEECCASRDFDWRFY